MNLHEQLLPYSIEILKEDRKAAQEQRALSLRGARRGSKQGTRCRVVRRRASKQARGSRRHRHHEGTRTTTGRGREQAGQGRTAEGLRAAGDGRHAGAGTGILAT